MLDDRDIDAIAERVIERLNSTPRSAYELLDPRELARQLRVSVDYVYAHANDLGAMRLGDGPKARLRFDLHTARAAMRARNARPSAITARR